MGDENNEFLEVDPDLRRLASEESAPTKECPFGKKCYRKNIQHLREYRHSKKIAPNSASSTTSRMAKGTEPTKKTTIKRPLDISSTKSIASYFKPRTSTVVDNEVDDPSKASERKEDGTVKAKRQRVETVSFANCSDEPARDNYDVEHSESDDELTNTFNDVKAAASTRKFNVNTDNGLKKNAKSSKCRKSSNDDEGSNNLRKLMPNIDQILAKPDNLKSNSKTPLEITTSSSSEWSESQPSQSTSSKFKDLSQKEWNELIERIFLVKMPSDFFLFWEFCKQIAPKNPRNALCNIFGFKLVGPFDVLAGIVEEGTVDQDTILRHWRFFYDPPEMQTFAVIDENSAVSFNGSPSYHLGYFRDTPDETSPVIVSNDPESSCVITGIADNIFAAIYKELVKRKASCKSNKFKMDQVNSFESKFKLFVERHNVKLDATDKMKERKKKVNAPTFHKFGIVVEVVNDVGYRELPDNDNNLMRMFQRITSLDNDEERRKCASMSQIHDILRRINYANDERDSGMGLEFGIDLFCVGHHFFHRSAKHLLTQAYELLGRDSAFSRIINAHLDNRKRGCKLDVTKE